MTPPLPKEKVRQGSTGKRVRYVLAASTAGAIIALALVFVALF